MHSKILVSTSARGLIRGLVVAALITCCALPAAAATYEVTTTEDSADGSCDGHCSLREAVIAANHDPGRDLILVPAGTYVLSLPGRDEDAARSGDLDVNETVIIRGAGRQRTVIDGGGVDRVLHVLRPPHDEESVEVERLSLRGGRVVGSAEGGGILNEGELVLRQVTISDNVAEGSGCDGGGIANGAATLSLRNVLISGNRTEGDDADGGGMWNRFGTVLIEDSEIRDNRALGAHPDGGGIFSQFGTLHVQDSTIAGNRADGPSASGGAIFLDASTLSVQASTMSSNIARAEGDARGGAIRAEASTMLLHNTTVSSNTARGDGSSRGGGLSVHIGTLSLSSATVADNSSGGHGAALHATDSTVVFTNTLLEGGCDLSIPPQSLGGNLESPGDSCHLVRSHDQHSVSRADLALGVLADNGGPTWTHALLPGSVAIDAGTRWDCPGRDQRGVARPVDGDGDGRADCDVGSYEAEGDAVAAYTSWLPVAVHKDGAAGSRWRTALAALNISDEDATLELVAHGDADGGLSTSVPAMGQLLMDDVLDAAGIAGGLGLLELRASAPLTISSRTYNLTEDGTLGQYVAAIADGEGLAAGEGGHLTQLSEGASLTTNLVVSNTGSAIASLRVRLFDEAGRRLAETSVDVSPRQVEMVNRLFATVAGVHELRSGYAEVELISGRGVVVFASLVDRGTGDATTIPLS